MVQSIIEKEGEKGWRHLYRTFNQSDILRTQGLLVVMTDAEFRGRIKGTSYERKYTAETYRSSDGMTYRIWNSWPITEGRKNQDGPLVRFVNVATALGYDAQASRPQE